MRLLREPLLHFLLAGALLFGIYAWLNREAGETGGQDQAIQVTEREVNWLAETWARQWQRPPDQRELQGLVTEYLREELLAREARALELDRDDVVVRRRLAQKMTFILEDTAGFAAPADEQLRSLFDADRTRFDAPAAISFDTVYFSIDKRGSRAASDARALLAGLVAAGTAVAATNAGDSTLLPREMRDADQQEIAGIFGAEFAAAVMALPAGTWHGPVESAFGQHLVRITDRREAQARSFEAVRGTLAEEWRRRSEAEAKALYFRTLLERYDIQATDTVRALIDPALANLRGETP